MSHLNPSKDQIKSLQEIPGDRVLQMVNLLKFKDFINAEKTISGKEQYKIYMRAASPFLEKAEAKVLYMGEMSLSIIGPNDGEWDMVLIVEYKSKKHFLEMAFAENYPTHLRNLALEDSRLIMCLD